MTRGARWPALPLAEAGLYSSVARCPISVAMSHVTLSRVDHLDIESGVDHLDIESDGEHLV